MFKKSFPIIMCLLSTTLLGVGNNNNKQTTKSAPPSSMAQGQQVSKIDWMTNFEQAAAKAKKENKPLLLFFTGSDWCGWCKKLESEVFATPEFARSVGNRFVFVDLDYPMSKKQPADIAQQNAELKKKYGISGFPTIVILDPSQNFIAETGYRPGGGKAYADYLLSLLQ